MSSENPYQSPQTGFDPDDFAHATAEKPTLVSLLFSFQGRVPRRVYWGVSLGIPIIFFAVMIALMAVFGEDSGVAEIAILVLYVPMVWTSIAVQIKRWHDLDKSGWWILIGFIPLIGPIWVFVENGCMRGTFGENQYGPDPT